MKRTTLSIFLLLIVISGFRMLDDVPFQVPANWPKPQYNFTKNPLNSDQIELGRHLFYDPILSRDSTISCSSCHSQYTAFTHVDHDLSHGIEDRIGFRNAPAVMNLAWQKVFMWDGAINHLDMQSLAPIENPDEMDEHFDRVIKKLNANAKYKTLFKNAFGDEQSTGEKTLKAIAQFMLTIVSANSLYDKMLRKEISYNTQQENGYRLFKSHCASCHTEPLFTNSEFENNGLRIDTSLMDYGRMRVTQNAKDSIKFKVPTLRNIEFSFPYMHDGRFKKLSEVLNHYASGVQQGPTLSKKLQNKIELTSNEKVDLTAFLLTLTDREFLFNQKHSYPK